MHQIKQTLPKFPPQTFPLQPHLSIQQHIKPIIQTTINHFPTLHIIINNAPFQNSIPTHQISIHHSQKLIHINLTPPFLASTQPINQFLNENKKPTII
ncbi:SDR family NAD(P)-dependent oxidoreductase, partial [Staphylococcus epidermidis]|uniref:SDR family NAD(P)-dependent oxidoreductase n=1 Tax=Staphylococcus epidermidis TaxID=1282 RepID=UPI0037DA2FB3